MRIGVLVPSQDNLQQAGVRIRYRRIEDSLKNLGHELEVIHVESFGRKADFVHDVYIISKCYDARSLAIAGYLAQSNKLVGVDLFDNYFSQLHDSRLSRMRHWFNSLKNSIDFILYSTPAMLDIVTSLGIELPAHVMNDPSLPLDRETIGRSLQQKLDFVHKTKMLNIGWFGIGDNPYFPVGLTDLVAFEGELARLRNRGFGVQLDILTNRRAMTPDNLATLGRISIPHTVEEWTMEREPALLAKSLACFLPVNAQDFSIVKSLNRAVSALTAGTQVLSSGYPLYEQLSDFVYRDPIQMLDDLLDRRLLLRNETLDGFVSFINENASPDVEAARLVEFLESISTAKSTIDEAADEAPFAAVIHGRNTSTEIHKFVQRMGGLSVGTPFCGINLNFDIRFSISADPRGIDIYIGEKYCSMLSEEIQALLTTRVDKLVMVYRKLEYSRLFPGPGFNHYRLFSMDTPAGFITCHAGVIKLIERAMHRLFPGIACFHSEQSRLPLWGPSHEENRDRYGEVA